jgi:FAD/FMN-containing dehydrogenase
MCVEINSPRAQEYLATPIEPRDPDHHHAPVRLQNYSSWNVLVRASGSDSVLNRYRQELGSAVTQEIQPAEEKQLWGRISNFEPAVVERHRNAMVINVSVSIADVQVALQAAEDSAVEHNLLCASIGRITAGSLVIAFMPLAVDPPSAMQFANAASSLRGRLPRDASAVAVRCPKESKSRFDVWGTTPTDLEIMRNLRAAMDSKKILNRGRFLV